MDKIKKLLLIQIPMSICNFRCHYCYLSHMDKAYEGKQSIPPVSPKEFGRLLSKERIGGIAFANFCANGETLMVKDLDKYVLAFVEQGHYAEIVTNLTMTKQLEQYLSWNRNLLKQVEFKCSFHFLELKKRNLLETFAENVKKIWEAGASANIELMPSDELIPYIDEVKEFSIKHFGALPHLTVARKDNTVGIQPLTELSEDEYNATWSQFDSEFWRFKTELFGKKQKGFCYAGQWGYTLNFETGELRQCYCGKPIGNIYANPEAPFPKVPIGRCVLPHCYNGHALLGFGMIPHIYSTRYGDIRNRQKSDGSQWLQPELLTFFNSKLVESNKEIPPKDRRRVLWATLPERAMLAVKRSAWICMGPYLRGLVRPIISKLKGK